MASTAAPPKKLVTGMRMSLDEFISVWDQIPELKRAELIDGTVYVASPVSWAHSRYDLLSVLWLGTYAAASPGMSVGLNGSWMMLDSMPQPDSAIWIDEAYGGRVKTGVWKGENYPEGAPDLAIEVCVSSTARDFGPKLALYQRAGVREYITFETQRKRITWRVLDDGSYRQLEAVNGVFRSLVFPGLWLDQTAFWSNDAARIIAVLKRGMRTKEHRAFVTGMSRRSRLK